MKRAEAGEPVEISLRINGEKVTCRVPPHVTLLRFLREYVGLTGTKEGCSAGECGACTVLFNGRAVNSCLVLAVEADGANIRTVEGECRNNRLSRLQELLDKHHAVQCGFCTPGMIMSIRDLLARHPKPTLRQIQEGIEGNFCRCTGYVQIIEAILEYTGQLKKKGELKRVRG
ncbi:MAG: (2Fe-2S)-binding protein [Candidatus Hydrogenedentota bacterium]|nr:MAG: (2Fe-2S)-binding protein [Candidatus Hydrogenedentota bacterium]